jgi:hypothetical protein
MAQTPDLTGRTEITLGYMSAMLEDLTKDADRWNARSEDERVDFALDWEEMMQRVEDLANGRYAAEVTTDQHVRLRKLAERLARSRETIVRLGLDFPDLTRVLDDKSMSPNERVNLYLTSLHRWAGRLRTMGDFWDSPLLDARERQAFPREWDDVMDRFAEVEALAARGALQPSARDELRQVAGELTELLPTMRRLGIRLPDLEALERARSVEAA